MSHRPALGDRIAAFLHAHPGATTIEVVQGVGARRQDVLHELRDGGHEQRPGPGRAARWYPAVPATERFLSVPTRCPACGAPVAGSDDEALLALRAPDPGRR